ncbi:FtsQ-type POTRA domain-containing protein [bacterium 210820-DFI.6.37]|nr:FtsQ-type POTRA domain-containing protein [bacterium 210820-DFI.6.37]
MKKDYHTTKINTEEYETDTTGSMDMKEEGAPERAPSQVSSGKRPVRKKKKRKKKRYLLKLVILIALCVGLYFFLHSSVFNIKTITTGESSRFTAEEIQDMAGLKKGMNLFEFRSGSCEDKLTENPYIKEASVKRKLPSGVEIQLTERQEAAVIQKDSEYVIIDASGTVLDIAEKAPKLTLLEGLTITEAEPGSGVTVKEDKVLQQELKILKEMTKADLYFKKIQLSGILVKAYVNDKLICSGKTTNLMKGMEEGNLKAVLYDLVVKRKIKKGVINIGDDQYYSFNKKGK